MDTQQKLILYAGSSFSTLQALNRLIPILGMMHIRPIMIFPKVPDKNPLARTPQMEEFSFADRRLMQDVIIPFMDDHDPILKDGQPNPKIIYTPKQLCQIYADAGTEAHTLDDVNSEAHCEYVLSDPSIIGGLSDRCLQRFEQPIINAHTSPKNLPNNADGFFWNAHPGRLPYIRGLLPIFHAAASGARQLTATLHAIEDRNIDTGRIIGEAAHTFDPSKSIWWHYTAMVDPMVATIVKHLEDVLTHGAPTSAVVQQNKEDGAYFSYPTPVKIEEFKAGGGLWVDPPHRVRDQLVTAFTNGNYSGLKFPLTAVVDDAIRVEKGQQPCSASNTKSIRRTDPARPPLHSGALRIA